MQEKDTNSQKDNIYYIFLIQKACRNAGLFFAQFLPNKTEYNLMKIYLLRYLVIFLIIVMTSSGHATVFSNISIKAQVDEADFAAEVTLLDKKVYLDGNGLIVSSYNFSVNEGYGLSDKIINLEIPGGTLNGVTSEIDSAPQFKKNEKIFLLLKKVESKLYLSNFSLGEYKIIKKNNKEYYQSVIYLNDPNSGIIEKEKMISLVMQKSNQLHTDPVLKIKNENKNVHNKEFHRPMIAVANQNESNIRNGIFNSINLVILLLGLIFSIWFFMKKKKL